MSKFILYVLPILLLSSCNQTQEKNKEEFDIMFAEVMKIHDDVMPETNNLYKLKKFAQENIDVLPDTSSYVEKLKDVQLFSEKADDAMMEWMANFKIPEADHIEKIKYLEKEKISISKVRDLMLNTLYEGKQMINESDKYIRENKLRNASKTKLVPVN